MEGPVALAVLGAAVLHALWNALLKKGGDPVLGAALLGLGSTLTAFLLLPFLPLPARESWPWMGISIGVHLAYVTLLANAYRVADLGSVYAVMRGLPPVIVAVGGALILGEQPGISGWIGVGLVSTGILLLQNRKPGSGLGLVLALGAALTIATYTLLDGMAVRLSGNPASYVLWHAAFQGLLFAAAVGLLRGRRMIADSRGRWPPLFLAGAVAVGGYGIVLWAMTRAPIALVSALRETSVLFAALIGVLWLGEPVGRRRVGAVVLVALGAGIIQLGR